MTTLDWIILLFVSVLAVYGYARGFVVGFLSLAGFAAGAFIATRLAPLLLSEGSRSPYAPLLGLAGALLLGGFLATGLEFVGVELRRRIRIPGFGVFDGLLGAGLSACVGFGIAWILGAVVLQTPGAGQWRDDIQRSVVLQRLNQLLPPSGPILNALARFDPRNDVAILSVAGLDAPALRLAPTSPAGTSAAVLGFPEDGPYDARAGRLGATEETLTQDAYGRGPVRRLITSLRGLVREGNSGGPVVDADGRVLATVFAATVGGPRAGGYGVPDSIVRAALATAGGTADTGPCAR